MDVGNLQFLYGIFLLVAKIGICMSFNCLYCSFSEMFPPLFSVTAFAICNFLARFASFFAPQIAEIQSPLPVALQAGLSIACLVAVGLINPT